ncbi:metalloprotease [Staphylococcus phage Metroid]|nr:metalloprotease [Staphylococcus phage Metroid]
MSNKTITNHLLNLEGIKIETYSIIAHIKKQTGWGDKGDSFEIRISYIADKDPRTVRYITTEITVDYSSNNPKEILLQLKDKIFSIVEEQVETDNDFIESIKEINSTKELEKLKPYINNEYYSMFKSSIEKEIPVALSSEVLNRCTGKTSTLAYLALEKDLPLVVSNEPMRKMLKNKFPHLRVSSAEDYSNYDIKGEIVLIDEVDIDQLYSADKVSVDALLVGIIKN